MAIYLEMPQLNKEFPFRLLVNDGNILTTPHWHREIELIYVTEGTINLGINDQPFTLSAGEMVLINGGDLHYVLASPGSERVVYQFDLAYFAAMTEEPDLYQLFTQLPPLSRDWQETAQEIQSLLSLIYDETLNEDAGMEFEIRAALFKLVSLFIRKIPKNQWESREIPRIRSEDILARLDQVFRFVEERYTESITLQEAADAIGYSQFYFTKFFKKNTGKTFITFLNDYRIDKAKWLLINTGDSISEIITQVGFESDKTFYRLFKQSMGVSPLAYRRKMQTRVF